MPKQDKRGGVQTGNSKSKNDKTLAWAEFVSYDKAPLTPKTKSAGKKPAAPAVSVGEEFKTQTSRDVNEDIKQDGKSATSYEQNKRFGEVLSSMESMLEELLTVRNGYDVTDHNNKLTELSATIKEHGSNILEVLRNYSDANDLLSKVNDDRNTTNEIARLITDLNAVLTGKLKVDSLRTTATLLAPMERLLTNITKYVNAEKGTVRLSDINEQFRTIVVSDTTSLSEMADNIHSSAVVNDGYHGEAQINYVMPSPVTTHVISKLRELGVSNRFLYDLGNYVTTDSSAKGRVNCFGAIVSADESQTGLSSISSMSNLFDTLIAVEDTPKLSNDQKAVWDTLFNLIVSVKQLGFKQTDTTFGIDESVYNMYTSAMWSATPSANNDLEQDGMSADLLRVVINNNGSYIDETLIPEGGYFDTDFNTANLPTSPIFAQIGAQKRGSQLFNADLAIKWWMQSYMNTVFLYIATADIWSDALIINELESKFINNKPFITIQKLYDSITNRNVKELFDKIKAQYDTVGSTSFELPINMVLFQSLINGGFNQIEMAKNGNYYEYIQTLVMPISPMMMRTPVVSNKNHVFTGEDKSERKIFTTSLFAAEYDVVRGFNINASKEIYNKTKNELVIGKITNIDMDARYADCAVKGHKWDLDGNNTNNDVNDRFADYKRTIENYGDAGALDNPLNITFGNNASNVADAFKRGGNGGDNTGSYADKDVAWEFSFESMLATARSGSTGAITSGLYIPQGLALTMTTNHWTDGIIFNGLTLDKQSLDRVPVKLNFFNLMNLYDDILTLCRDDVVAVDSGDTPMSHMLAREISFIPEIAGPADLDRLCTVNVGGRLTDIIPSTPVFPFIYNGQFKYPAIKLNEHTNRVFTVVNNRGRETWSSRILNAAASGLPIAGANSDIVRVKQHAGRISYIAKPLLIQSWRGTTLLDAYRNAADGEDTNDQWSVMKDYSYREFANGVIGSNNILSTETRSPLLDLIVNREHDKVLFVPALAIDNANELVRNVPRMFIIAKALLLSILRGRWHHLVRNINTNSATLQMLVSGLSGNTWFKNYNVNTTNIDNHSLIKVYLKEEPLMVPTVEVKTAADLSSSTMMEHGLTKGQSPIDKLANAFTVTNYLPTHSAINQRKQEFVAFGRFGTYGTSLGDIAEIIRNNQAKLSRTTLERGVSHFDANRKPMLLVNYRNNKFDAMDNANIHKLYHNPVSLFACTDYTRNNMHHVNNIDYIADTAGIITNSFDMKTNILTLEHNILPKALKESSSNSDYRGEFYTNDVFVSPLYSTIFGTVSNKARFVPVSDTSHGRWGKNYADISWMKYVLSNNHEERGYNYFNMLTVPAYSRRSNQPMMDEHEYNPDVLIDANSIKASSIRQRQILDPTPYPMLDNPEGVGANSRRADAGEFCYITETSIDSISRYSAHVITSTEYWPSTYANGAFKRTTAARYCDYEVANDSMFGRNTILMRTLFPIQNVINREQYHGYMNRLLWKMMYGYDLTRGYNEYLRAVDLMIFALKQPFGPRSVYDTAGRNSLYPGVGGYSPKVSMGAMLYGISMPTRKYEEGGHNTNTGTSIGVIGIYNMDGHRDAATMRGSYGVSPMLATIRREFISTARCSVTPDTYNTCSINTYEQLGFDIQATEITATHDGSYALAWTGNRNTIMIIPMQRVRNQLDKDYLEWTFSTKANTDFTYLHGNDVAMYNRESLGLNSFATIIDNGLLQFDMREVEAYIKAYAPNWTVELDSNSYSEQVAALNRLSRL